MQELLDEFVDSTKGHQVLIVQPTIAAMIYARNSKSSCFTGFFQIKSPGSRFKYQDFLAA